ncbi:hypothetical protein TNCV_1433551 [Trichonephila clavipes]|nr:hypothetical protein TNCV_1433551 [Trichonephila clavipes]
MVEVKPINISLNQHSTSLSVRTAISPTLTEEFIIHPRVYSEIEKLGHAKSDVLLNESESSLGVHAYTYSSAVSFPNVSVSNVIENSSYDLSHVENFNTRNDSSSLIKDYKCNKIKITKLKLSIVREKCSDIVLSRQWKRRKREIVLNRHPELYRGKYRCVQPKDQLVEKMFLCRFSSGSPWKYRCGQRTVRMAVVACSQNQAVFARRRIKVKAELKLKKAETLEKNLEN